jgi:hypothetical protein
MRVVIANKHRSMIGGRGPLQEHKIKITEEHIKLLREKAVAALLGVDRERA